MLGKRLFLNDQSFGTGIMIHPGKIAVFVIIRKKVDFCDWTTNINSPTSTATNSSGRRFAAILVDNFCPANHLANGSAKEVFQQEMICKWSQQKWQTENDEIPNRM